MLTIYLAFKGFTGLYQGSEKEPDLFLRPDSSTFPTVVIESGWSESFPYLRRDKDLWMQGCPTVNVVILLKWSELSGKRVKGTAEIWTRDAAGNLQSREMVRTCHKTSIRYRANVTSAENLSLPEHARK